MRASAFLLIVGVAAIARAHEGGRSGAGAPEIDAPARLRGFVRVEGDRFVVDGRPLAFVGANVNALQGELQRAQYRETLAALAADGLTVARIWAFAEGPTDAGEWWRKDHLFRAGPDGFIEEAYRHLDAVVAEAGRLGIRLIVTLGNNWGDYGGIPMYLAWSGLPPGRDATDPAREAFYTDERARGFYRAGVARLLERVNTVSGLRYVDDPAIFSWELLNESTVVTPAGAAARRGWVAEMAGFIKQRDRHHLVAAGIADYRSRDERRDWIAVHRLPVVDYCDSHLYAEQDPHLQGLGGLRDSVDDRAQLARFVIGKPLVIGEFGFRTDRASRWRGAERGAWFRRLLERAVLDGVAGALPWIYQPWSGAPRDFGIYTDRHDTDDVRGVIRAMAGIFAGSPEPGNPRLGPANRERPLYDLLVTLVRSVSPAHRVRVRADAVDVDVEIAPERFELARFERAGVSRDGPLPHVYGGGFGRLVYRFEAPAMLASSPVRPVRSISIGARLSSEWPGFTSPPGMSAAEAGSRVQLLLDGQRVATLAVPPDDGQGSWREVTIDDPRLLARMATGVHTLVFAVPDQAGSNGLCVYGAPRADRPRPDGEAGPIRIRYHR